ncbi:MAG: aminotransferase class I/II-fold pyridoxal phosphate-dependent enzyme [Acidimicrobiia bacterium]
MTDRSQLSSFGEALAADSSLPFYLLAHLEKASEATDSSAGNQPYTCLSVSENKLMWDLLSEKVNTNRDVPMSAMGYGPKPGSPEFRTAISDFGSEFVWGVNVPADEIVSIAGAGAAVEAIAATLCEPGEAILIPTPTYAVYWVDIESRFGVKAVGAPMAVDDDFLLSVEHLEAAYAASAYPVKVLLLTTPSNPLGRITEPERIKKAVAWARSKNLHVIINELYALSTFGPTEWASAALYLDRLADDVHLMWGFSKDFSVSGLRAGVVHSKNPDVLAALAHHAIFSAVSGDTQHLLTNMLTDRSWSDRYLASMRSRLSDARAGVESALSAHGLRAVDGDAALFLVADLRPLLIGNSWEGERNLWQQMLDHENVNITPGSSCRMPEPGFMRICFATAPTPVVVDAVDRALTSAAR